MSLSPFGSESNVGSRMNKTGVQFSDYSKKLDNQSIRGFVSRDEPPHSPENSLSLCGDEMERDRCDDEAPIFVSNQSDSKSKKVDNKSPSSDVYCGPFFGNGANEILRMVNRIQEVVLPGHPDFRGNPIECFEGVVETNLPNTGRTSGTSGRGTANSLEMARAGSPQKTNHRNIFTPQLHTRPLLTRASDLPRQNVDVEVQTDLMSARHRNTSSTPQTRPLLTRASDLPRQNVDVEVQTDWMNAHHRNTSIPQLHTPPLLTRARDLPRKNVDVEVQTDLMRKCNYLYNLYPGPEYYRRQAIEELKNNIRESTWDFRRTVRDYTKLIGDMDLRIQNNQIRTARMADRQLTDLLASELRAPYYSSDYHRRATDLIGDRYRQQTVPPLRFSSSDYGSRPHENDTYDRFRARTTDYNRHVKPTAPLLSSYDAAHQRKLTDDSVFNAGDGGVRDQQANKENLQQSCTCDCSKKPVTQEKGKSLGTSVLTSRRQPLRLTSVAQDRRMPPARTSVPLQRNPIGTDGKFRQPPMRFAPPLPKSTTINQCEDQQSPPKKLPGTMLRNYGPLLRGQRTVTFSDSTKPGHEQQENDEDEFVPSTTQQAYIQQGQKKINKPQIARPRSGPIPLRTLFPQNPSAIFQQIKP